MNNGENGWNKWEQLVLDKLDTLEEDNKEVKIDVKLILMNHLPHLREEIAALKVKAGIWGAIAGALPASIISVIAFLIMLSQLNR